MAIVHLPTGPVELPDGLWRVVWLEGFGWPECERQELTQRTYTSRDQAAKMLATIERLPSHHRLIGVWRTDTQWREENFDVDADG